MAHEAWQAPAIRLRTARVYLFGSNAPASGFAGRFVLQYAAPPLIPIGGRAEEVPGGGEKRVRSLLFARQCQQKALTSGSEAAPRKTSS